MATQIAYTPTLQGKEAKKAWKQANTQPIKKATDNAKKGEKYFDKLLSEKR